MFLECLTEWQNFDIRRHAFDGLLQSLGRQEIESRVNGELNRQLDKGLNRLLDKLR